MKVTLPKHATNHVYWSETGQSGWAYVLVGYCPDTLAYFKAIGERLKKQFPEVKETNITCAKVSKSESVYGFTIGLTSIKGPKRKIKGWSERPIDFNY